uniref:Uncharacterized protein n=1 Tax=Mycena chlorophos TaxID=658473 RepID=A0ABQ0LVZ1_MYCCL|nr:predicted protein [Mycena chlorophos]
MDPSSAGGGPHDPFFIDTWTSKSWQGYEILPKEAKNYLNKLSTALKGLVHQDSDWELPIWGPEANTAPPELEQWIKEQKIPHWHGRPSLLLHKLGTRLDSIMATTLNKVFKCNSSMFLINASGSGKTRHILEALCEYWGFYYIKRADGRDLGSNDLRLCITRIESHEGFIADLESCRSTLDDDACKVQGRKNSQIAEKCISHIFLARHLIFKLYLEVVLDLGYQPSKEYSRRWVLLQLMPSLLSGLQEDIFGELSLRISAGDLSSAQCQLLNHKIYSNAREIIAQTEKTRLVLYTVIDEAQLLINDLVGAFLNSQNTEYRTFFRELMVFGRDKLALDLDSGTVGTGTGLKLDELQTDLQSTFAKVHDRNVVSYTSGSFGLADSEDALHRQEAYIREYLPPALQFSDTGKRLIHRIKLWVAGRFRLTASFLEHLLLTNFDQPHRELDKWIFHHTRFTPTDNIHDQSQVPSPYQMSLMPIYDNLQFNKIRLKTAIESLRVAVMQSLLRYKIIISLANQQLFVECSFARFEDSSARSARIFEPLIVLAATSQLELEAPPAGMSPSRYVQMHIADTSQEMNGMENYTAMVLAEMFGDFEPLKSVFQLHSDAEVPSWFNKRARLVVVHRESLGADRMEHSIYPANWPRKQVPSGQFGQQTNRQATMEWLRLPGEA